MLINTFAILGEFDCNNYDLFCTELNENIKEALVSIRNNPENAMIHNKITKLLYSELAYFDFNKYISFYVTIESIQTEKIIMDIGFSGIFKMWINQEPICIGMEFQQRKFINLLLKKGKNEIIIEYINQRDNILAHGYIQIYNYETVLRGKIFPSLANKVLNSKIEVISKYDADEGILEFMLLCPKDLSIQAEYINLDMDEREKVELRGLTKYRIGFEHYKERIFHFGIKLRDEDDFISLAVNLPERELSILYDMAETYKYEEYPQSGIMVRGLLKKLAKTYLPMKRRYDLAKLLHNILNKYQVHTDRKYYLSDIDSSVQEVIVKLPDDYEDTISYPLVLYLVDKEEAFFSETISDYTGYILADFYCGGILGGGYMSEARYLEVLKYLFDNYNIDKNRIYMIGQSHSSFDLWFLLETRPDLIAAAFIISGSPKYDNIRNVSNQHITNVISNYDYNYINNYGVIKDTLKSNRYQEIELKDIIHDSLSDYTLYPILDFFHGKQREEYPREIHFRTEMNRYLKSYWIRAYGITYGKTYLRLSAKIVSNDVIQIAAENVVGFEIKLPPIVNKKKFVIVVNEESFEFANYCEKSVIFSFDINNQYMRVNRWSLPIRYRKGLGILDVFTAPLKIYIPENHSRIVFDTAEKFSSPLTYGVINKFDIKYPIDSIKNYDASQCKNHNMVFIAVNNNIQDIEQYFGTNMRIPIKTYSDYFQYKDRKYFEDYCILQIIANPDDNERSILFIHANNEKLLQRNLLTRNVIIPFMFNGFHSYYHNEAVVMYKNKYYAIYEWGNDLTEI
ncbi:hypothetical protein [Anaerocolumna cellulosilytica]|nr:hypothetical protein [Anaerocolumna cellulosilytica]MBB5194870.1 hypothetical protein [Anaerocolumna cellulosilytica]